MMIGRKLCDWVRAAPYVGVVLPFLLLLFLLPTPTEWRSDDYLPSARGRTVAVKIFKTPKPLLDANGAVAGFDFVHVVQPQPIIILQASVLAELSFQLRHFDFLNNRLGRSPPAHS